MRGALVRTLAAFGQGAALAALKLTRRVRGGYHTDASLAGARHRTPDFPPAFFCVIPR